MHVRYTRGQKSLLEYMNAIKVQYEWVPTHIEIYCIACQTGSFTAEKHGLVYRRNTLWDQTFTKQIVHPQLLSNSIVPSCTTNVSAP